MTPEGKVKAKVKKLLKRYPLYSNWPVPCGYGVPMLDCVGCFYGLFFSIETKAPGGKPTLRQQQTIEEQRAAGAQVFVIDGDTTELEEWLENVARSHKRETQDGGGSSERGSPEPVSKRPANDNQWGATPPPAARTGRSVPTEEVRVRRTGADYYPVRLGEWQSV